MVMRTLNEMMSLNGKLAVVTGGRGWLGSAISDTLLELGAHVISVSRGKSCVFDVTNFTNLREYVIDLDDQAKLETSVAELMKFIKTTYAMQPSVLINNMCVWPTELDFAKTSLTQMTGSITSNIIPQLYLTQQVTNAMIEGGSVINVASMYAKVAPDPKMYRGVGGNALEYGAAKAALSQATRYLAASLGPRKIRVNSISPGPFSRPGSLDDKEWFRQELNNRTMLGRVAQRDEVKGVIALLATDLGSYITGEDIAVDGGWTKL